MLLVSFLKEVLLKLMMSSYIYYSNYCYAQKHIHCAYIHTYPAFACTLIAHRRLEYEV